MTMRWFARLSFRRVIMLALLWPLVLMIIVAVVTAIRISQAHPDDGYFLVATVPRIELVIVPPVLLVAVWWFVRKHRRGAGQ